MSDEKFKLFMNASSDGISIWDSRLNLIDLNEARLNMFLPGTKREDVIGKNILELAPRLKETGRYDKYLEVLKTGKPVVMSDVISGFPATSRRHVVVKAFKFGSSLGMVVTDITETKQIENQLLKSSEEIQRLHKYAISLREEERQNLSRLVHDDLGQSLVILKMDLVWLQRNINKEDIHLSTKLESMLELLDTTSQIVKSISYELRPQEIGNLSLIHAINWQITEFEEISGIKCIVNQKLDRFKIGNKINSLVIRIIREALINVFRHANATQVEIILRIRKDKLIVKIIDNGKGISRENIRDHKSLGLISMRDYAEAGGGKITIKGKPLQGTTISLSIPFK